MPRFDGTGPRGMGPMTGGGRGFCAIPFPATWPYQQVPYPFYAGTPSTPAYTPFAPQMTKEQELDFLKNQAEAMREQLEQIEAKIQQLGEI